MLDGKLKQLNRTGKYVEKKKAGVITVEMEEKLWESRMLGDQSPEVLVDTVLYLIGLNFALRSGEEHRHLQYLPYLMPLKNLSMITGKGMYLLDIINCQKQYFSW